MRILRHFFILFLAFDNFSYKYAIDAAIVKQSEAQFKLGNLGQ